MKLKLSKIQKEEINIVIKLPVVKSLTKKVKIKSITKLSPRIIL